MEQFEVILFFRISYIFEISYYIHAYNFHILHAWFCHNSAILGYSPIYSHCDVSWSFVHLKNILFQIQFHQSCNHKLLFPPCTIPYQNLTKVLRAWSPEKTDEFKCLNLMCLSIFLCNMGLVIAIITIVQIIFVLCSNTQFKWISIWKAFRTIFSL